MKKAISILLALVMCFALAMPAFAADEQLPPVNNDTEATLPAPEIPGVDGDVMGKIMAAIQDLLDQLGGIDVTEGELASQIRDILNKVLGESFIKDLPEGALKDFINWVINIYYPLVPEVPETSTEAPTEAPTEEETTTEAAELPETGDSAVALAVFGTVAVAAAAAFVCTKKKA